MKMITSRDQIPELMSDEEAAEFWSNHTLSDELLEASIIEEEDHDLPKRKSATISIRLDEDLLQRIRTLAKLKNKGYQTLIKDFLIERTYEEEKKTSSIRRGTLRSSTDNQLTLEQQLEMAFNALQQELSELASGTIIVQIRDNLVGKFGIRTIPLELTKDQVEMTKQGLTQYQQRSLQLQAIEALKHKKNWTHGEIRINFLLQNSDLHASVQIESSYNAPNQIIIKPKNSKYAPRLAKPNS